jgi:hypothetical protein
LWECGKPKVFPIEKEQANLSFPLLVGFDTPANIYEKYFIGISNIFWHNQQQLAPHIAASTSNWLDSKDM